MQAMDTVSLTEFTRSMRVHSRAHTKFCFEIAMLVMMLYNLNPEEQMLHLIEAAIVFWRFTSENSVPRVVTCIRVFDLLECLQLNLNYCRRMVTISDDIRMDPFYSHVFHIVTSLQKIGVSNTKAYLNFYDYNPSFICHYMYSFVNVDMSRDSDILTVILCFLDDVFRIKVLRRGFRDARHFTDEYFSRNLCSWFRRSDKDTFISTVHFQVEQYSVDFLIVKFIDSLFGEGDDSLEIRNRWHEVANDYYNRFYTAPYEKFVESVAYTRDVGWSLTLRNIEGLETDVFGITTCLSKIKKDTPHHRSIRKYHPLGKTEINVDDPGDLMHVLLGLFRYFNDSCEHHCAFTDLSSMDPDFQFALTHQIQITRLAKNWPLIPAVWNYTGTYGISSAEYSCYMGTVLYEVSRPQFYLTMDIDWSTAREYREYFPEILEHLLQFESISASLDRLIGMIRKEVREDEIKYGGHLSRVFPKPLFLTNVNNEANLQRFLSLLPEQEDNEISIVNIWKYGVLRKAIIEAYGFTASDGYIPICS